ncbi:MAG: molybdopterin-dependent oxidoreductase [Acidobacteria bacterium]|nr:molybdopterin-dependent oxidoreductase [Acidobacteriota bacterium]
MNDLVGLNIDGRENGAPTGDDLALAAGLMAAIVSTAAGAIAWLAYETPFLPLRVVDAIFAVVPAEIVQIGVAFLGPWAKRLAFAASVGGELTILAFLARTFAARFRTAGLAGALAMGAAIWLVASLTVIPLAGGGPFGVAWRPSPSASALSLLSIGLLFGGAFHFASRLLHASPAIAASAATIASRRTFFGSIVAAGVAVVLVEGLQSIANATGWGRGDRVSGGSGVFPDIDGLSREVTPAADFYHVSKNVFDPDSIHRDWRLHIGGLVEKPMSWTLEELKALPAVEGFATLACIENPVGGDLIGNAFWRGVSLAVLLEAAGVAAGAVDLAFTALDDYTDSIAIERAMRPGCMLAYEMNGEPLDSTHGAPSRLIVPGIFGMKNVKWISRIDVAGSDVKGYWQRRGWNDVAEYRTMSRIDVATPGVAGRAASLAGVAFAGDRGIERVEVSTDGGSTWMPAHIRQPLSPNSWVLWHAEWTPARPGRYDVAVRAVDGAGRDQIATPSSAFPDGVTGLHHVIVPVTG